MLTETNGVFECVEECREVERDDTAVDDSRGSKLLSPMSCVENDDGARAMALELEEWHEDPCGAEEGAVSVSNWE